MYKKLRSGSDEASLIRALMNLPLKWLIKLGKNINGLNMESEDVKKSLNVARIVSNINLSLIIKEYNRLIGERAELKKNYAGILEWILDVEKINGIAVPQALAEKLHFWIERAVDEDLPPAKEIKT